MAGEGPVRAGASRRPIAARELALSRRLARLLAATGASANAVSLAGLAAALLAACAILAAEDGPTAAPWAWFAAAALVEIRLLANMLDGMVAFETGTSSRLGEMMNEFPDRLADIAVLVALGYAPGGAIWLGYVAALAAVLTAYVRVAGVALGAVAEFCGPMAKPQRMHIVAIVALLCAVTEGAAWPDVDAVGWATFGLAVIVVGSIATIVRRVHRIAQSLR